MFTWHRPTVIAWTAAVLAVGTCGCGISEPLPTRDPNRPAGKSAEDIMRDMQNSPSATAEAAKKS